MRKKKKNKKIITSIILFILILLIILSICLIYFIKQQSEKASRTRVIGVYDQTQEELPNLKFTNISNLSVCTSDSSRQVEIAKKFEIIFEEELPDIYNQIVELNEKEIINYYENNEDTIRSNLYNIEKEDFVKLCSKLQNMESNLDNDFDICNFSQQENYVVVECRYKNNETIKFKLTKYQILTFLE